MLDTQLADREDVAGAYSIADIAIWPWSTAHAWQGVSLEDYPHVKRWYQAMTARPAVQKGFKVPNAEAEIPLPT